MKNILLIIIIVLFGCKTPSPIITPVLNVNLTIETTNNNCDTIYGGYIINCRVFSSYGGNEKSTYVVTDSLSLSLNGSHNIPKDKKTYVYIYDNDRRTAVFTWEGENKVYKIE